MHTLFTRWGQKPQKKRFSISALIRWLEASRFLLLASFWQLWLSKLAGVNKLRPASSNPSTIVPNSKQQKNPPPPLARDGRLPPLQNSQYTRFPWAKAYFPPPRSPNKQNFKIWSKLFAFLDIDDKFHSHAWMQSKTTISLLLLNDIYVSIIHWSCACL